MFRFSGVYIEKTCNILSCKRSKIGTFLDADWRSGGWILKEGAFSERLLKSPSFGTFLGDQEKYIPALGYSKTPAFPFAGFVIN